MNGDGKADLITGSYHPGEIYWFKGADGTFAAGQVIKETTPKTIERAATAVSAADWDGDGDLDLLAGNIQGQVHWLTNTGTPTQFAFGGRKTVMAGGKPLLVPGGDAHPVASDWDSDGVLDLLVGNGDGSVLFCKGVRKSAAGPPALQAGVPLSAGGKPIALKGRVKLSVCDWNGDGQMDLLAGNFDVNANAEDRARAFIGNVYLMLRQ